jgi:signal transduction histidine kinase
MQLVAGTLRDARRIVAVEAAPDSAEIRRARAALAAASTRVAALPYAGVPAAMRQALSRADEDLTRLENRVQEVLALADLGRLPEARARLRGVDTLDAAVNEDFSRAQRAGIEDLLQRQAALDGAAREATWLAAVLVLVALVLPALTLLVLQRRIARPLTGLSAALDRVGTGDLTVQLPVTRGDELGQLAEHFNQMTRVLRERAEGQGRFAATGELLAGIAHEVNNPLQAISTLAESRIDEPGVSVSHRADLQLILQQARRAGKLLSGLLHFVRPGEPEVADQDLADVVARVVDLLSYQFGVDEIRVENRVGAQLPHVRGDGARLEQVFVNLLSNAVDAVRSGATPRRIAIDGWEHEGRVHVAVVDNGPGIPEAVAARLFQPFVTTKGTQGTGLGLYVSRQLAREAGGDLFVRSVPGEGARFEVWLPAARRRSDAEPAAESSRSAAARALTGLTILVVDDEESIRRPLIRYLSRLGATAVDAADGLAALAKLRVLAVDAIVLDLRMPRMDGVETYNTLRRELPALADRVLFLSGDPQQMQEMRLGIVPSERVLAKPVDLPVLTASIRRLVGRRTPP